MVKLLQDRETLTLIEKRNIPTDSLVSPNYYNTVYKCLSNIRIMKVSLSNLTQEDLRTIERLKDELTLYTLVHNNPIIPLKMMPAVREVGVMGKLKDIQRVRIDREDYIDEFGRYVYLTTRVAKMGAQDVDLRYPFGKEEPELFPVEYVEYYDLRNRKPEPVHA